MDEENEPDMAEIVCHSLCHEGNGDLCHQQSVLCYISDDSDEENEEQLPLIAGDQDCESSHHSMGLNVSRVRRQMDRTCLAVDEGIGSDMVSVVSGFTPPLLTPQTSVEHRTSLLGRRESIGIGWTQKKEKGDDPDDDQVTGRHHLHHHQSTGDDISDIKEGKELEQQPQPSPESASPVMSTYDWPMTSTEKLLSKYAYKNEFSQLSRRMDNVLPLISSCQRETILQGLRALQQLIESAWKASDSDKIVKDLCLYFQNSGQLDVVINLFISGQLELRLEAGQVLDAYMSEVTCTHIYNNGFLRDIMKTIVYECDGKDSGNIVLSLSLLESLFRSGPESCKIVVECGGLEFLLDVCRNHIEVDTRLHAAVALANLSIFGGFEIRQTMVRKQVPAWLFVLLTNDDIRIKYYACLCLCMMASHKELERDVQSSGSLALVSSFLRSCKPEQLAKSDSKYRSGRSSVWLESFSALLNSTVPEVLATATFQLAMEASLRRGSARIDVFDELRLVSRIQEIASIPGYDLASKFAAKILNMIGEHVPYKLSQSAPLWTVKDVQYWVRKIGFYDYADTFVKHRVDGDLLLRTNDGHLEHEIGMKSAYERMRFMRELNSLKRSSEYSAVDRTRLDAWLVRLDPEFSVYTYQMLLNGVDRSTLIHLDDNMLKDVCGIENSVHRLKLMYAIKEVKHVEELDLALLRKQVDIFICYRRSTGSQLASLLKVHLQLRGFKVFIDVDRLYAGQFDKSLLMNIRAAKHFILVLTPRALDPCVGDDECKDWVHLEIQTALRANSNIVPVQEKGFEWPPTQQLPADIQRICGYNTIQWVHEYQEACVDKLHKFLSGQATMDATAAAPAPAPVVA